MRRKSKELKAMLRKRYDMKSNECLGYVIEIWKGGEVAADEDVQTWIHRYRLQLQSLWGGIFL